MKQNIIAKTFFLWIWCLLINFLIMVSSVHGGKIVWCLLSTVAKKCGVFCSPCQNSLVSFGSGVFCPTFDEIGCKRRLGIA